MSYFSVIVIDKPALKSGREAPVSHRGILRQIMRQLRKSDCHGGGGVVFSNYTKLSLWDPHILLN